MALRLNGSWESTTLTSAKKTTVVIKRCNQSCCSIDGHKQKGVNLFNKLVFCSMKTDKTENPDYWYPVIQNV